MTNKHTGPSRTSSFQRVALRKGLGSPTGAGGRLAASTGNMGMLQSTGTPEEMTKQGRHKARDEPGGQWVPHLPLFPFHCTASAQAVSELWAEALSSPPESREPLAHLPKRITGTALNAPIPG